MGKKHPALAGLSAGEFFDRKLSGCSMSDASHSTRIAYSTIHRIARETGNGTPERETLQRLQDWSVEAGAPHGVYISAARTLGFEEPRSASGAR